ncbi:MoaD/ThiS family protein [Corynebacterium sp. UBA2622]|uniref:MoaD/ThiS family protein n=1 Tax=Corynebacterium sp. UBA2622 TaxID=1946393 RepID=UPI0025BFB846|nr:MoaD/ThiS family protein [Corynebacterium sp. UBA2622]
MRIHYFAAARAAAGVSEEEVGEFATLGEVLDDATRRHPGATDAGLTFADVLERCTFLVDGRRAQRGDPTAGAERLDVLPPFAGG